MGIWSYEIKGYNTCADIVSPSINKCILAHMSCGTLTRLYVAARLSIFTIPVIRTSSHPSIEIVQILLRTLIRIISDVYM